MATSNDDVTDGKVAAVVNDRELLINLGSVDGVEVGMRFVVLNREPVTIADPDSGDVLGSVFVPKTIVKVTRIDGMHLSAARTFRTIKGTPGLFVQMPSLTGTPDRVETLSVERGETLTAQLQPAERVVRVGDLVRKTSGDEYVET